MTNISDNLNPFEARLEAALRPVHPSNNYVQSVRQRINFKAPVEVAQRLSSQPSLLLILGGVLSVSLLIITTARAVFYLVNRSKL
ncbi:MAG: hypothetical protein HGB35_07765 [Geobacteraceae bacterium]|nr:hypothetical protein [Geobacteraceae bacterium]